MSKYDPLWKWIRENGTDSFKLTFGQIEEITGFPVDHAFLTYKKELKEYGYQVGKISLKERTVRFEKLGEGEDPGKTVTRLGIFFLVCLLTASCVL